MKVIWEGFARSWSVIKNNMLHQPRSSSQMSPAPSTQHVVWQELWIVKKPDQKGNDFRPQSCYHQNAFISPVHQAQNRLAFLIYSIYNYIYFLVTNLKQFFILLFHTKTIHHLSHKKPPFETTVNSLPPVNACAPKGGRFSPGKGAAAGGKVTGGNGLSVGKSWSTLHRRWRAGFCMVIWFFMRISPPNSLEVWMVRRSFS